ncbi:MAG: tetratricopeptide repeat protein [Treponema sp.]|nr:tetratricopeptide repeat protein [Treponema sp.]
MTVNNIFIEYYNIAEEYFRIKNYSKAAEYYKMASSDKEIYNAAYFKAARSYALAKDWTNAIQIYQEIVKKDKNNVTAKESLAYIYAMTNDFEKSERLYLELVSTNPDSAEVLINYTVVLLTLEKYQDAAEQLDLIKEKFPDEEKIKTLEEKINEGLNPPSDESEGNIPAELEQPELAPKEDAD